jgi:hypothetical protein
MNCILQVSASWVARIIGRATSALH